MLFIIKPQEVFVVHHKASRSARQCLEVNNSAQQYKAVLSSAQKCTAVLGSAHRLDEPGRARTSPDEPGRARTTRNLDRGEGSPGVGTSWGVEANPGSAQPGVIHYVSHCFNPPVNILYPRSWTKVPLVLLHCDTPLHLVAFLMEN